MRPIRIAVSPTAAHVVQSWDPARREEFILQVNLLADDPSGLLTRSSAASGEATLWEYRYSSGVVEGWTVHLLFAWERGRDPEFILIDVVDRMFGDR